MNPIALQIGGLTVYWYGILIVVSVLAGAGVAVVQARRRGQDPEHVWNALLVCLILGIIGARIYHVFSTSQGGSLGWSYYRQHPADVLKIWQGGLGLIGAIIGGSLGLVLYARLAKISAPVWLDIGALSLLIAQAIGRWGNWVNQELYGPPTALPWGIPIDLQYRIRPYNDPFAFPAETRFHPVFLYESLWCLLGFVLLWWLSRRLAPVLRDGDLFLGYLIWYPVGRFAIEYLRPDAWMWGPIAVAQIFCAASAIGAAAALVIRHRRRAAPAAPDAPAESQDTP
ncbi:MAG: prolipoprotein diacylglyceryl transferase [Anaerolineae bacterium]|nr:prolipoprotein diacylglyceryl transferase [Anaerolineae bacterium]